MSTPPPTTEPDPASYAAPAGPRVRGSDARALGRLRRSVTDRKVAGVAGGLGRHLDVDPTVIRVAFVALSCFGGAGLLLYAVGWLLVPEQGSDRAVLDLDPGVRTVVLSVAGVLAAVTLLGHSWGWGWGFGIPWPVTLIGLVVVAILAGRRRGGAVLLSPDPGPPAQPGADPSHGPGRRVSLDKTAVLPPGWVGLPPPPSAPWSPPPPAATPPRRRGPGLLMPTLALVLLGWGVLWTVDLGGDVPGAAYAALALAVCGLMLVVSAWFGRGGAVVLLGLLAAVGLAVSLVVQNGVGERVARPETAAQVTDGYRFGIGHLALDLSQIDDPQALAGRTLRLEADLGQIVIDLPPGIAVTATATADGGQVDVLGRTAEGQDLTVTRSVDGASATTPATAPLTILADIDYGQITVRSN